MPTPDTTDLDEIIAQNGGTGAWEEPTVPGSTPRWLFPRFAPPCTVNLEHGVMEQDAEDGSIFKCKKTAKCKGSKTLDSGDMYLSRSGLGYDTDVETLAAWLDAPRNRIGGIMLLGEPGTGKTALAQAACTYAGRETTVISATPDHTKDSLFMKFVGEGNGLDGTPFVLGALADAAVRGNVIIIDEFLMFMDGLKPVFYAFSDGSHWLPEANVDGSAVAIHPATRLIITANPQVRGASLPEPIASRFASTTVTVETSASMLRDLAIDEAIVAAWEALGSQNLWRPQIRELRAADYWLNANIVQACSALIPEHCPESERKAVRDIVVGFLGGAIRDDGRLVVS